jgi:hypothetical protein
MCHASSSVKARVKQAPRALSYIQPIRQLTQLLANTSQRYAKRYTTDKADQAEADVDHDIRVTASSAPNALMPTYFQMDGG